MLDTFWDFDLRNENIHTVSGLLKSFLRDMDVPVIPLEVVEPLWPVLDGDEATHDQLSVLEEVISRLPRASRCILKRVIGFGSIVADNEGTNRMSVKNIALVLGPSLVRRAGDNLSTESSAFSSGSYSSMGALSRDGSGNYIRASKMLTLSRESSSSDKLRSEMSEKGGSSSRESSARWGGMSREESLDVQQEATQMLQDTPLSTKIVSLLLAHLSQMDIGLGDKGSEVVVAHDPTDAANVGPLPSIRTWPIFFAVILFPLLRLFVWHMTPTSARARTPRGRKLGGGF